jgi:hypothetical protein
MNEATDAWRAGDDVVTKSSARIAQKKFLKKVATSLAGCRGKPAGKPAGLPHHFGNYFWQAVWNIFCATIYHWRTR